MDLDSGRHVAINIRTRTAHNLDNATYIERFFDRVLKAIDMRSLTRPKSVVVPSCEENVDSEHEDDGGLSTFCIISTSHVAYHSWPLQRRFRFSVDSCKDFDPNKVVILLQRHFEIEAISVNDNPYLEPRQSWLRLA